MVALSVVFFGGYNMPLGADINAEMAFLAEFFINFYGAFQNSIPKKYIIIFSITGMNSKSSFVNRFQSSLRGIIPSASRDGSTYQFRYTALSELEFHE